jgi:cell division transport system ATP-binding protein
MIEIKNATVAYPNGVCALSNVNLCVGNGEFVFIVGATGAGKSTLLKLLYREEKVTEGSVAVAGQELSKMLLREIPFYRRKLGIVFQDFGLLSNKTVYENVAFALRVTGANRTIIRKKVQETLEMVGMTHRPDAFPHQISGGEQQRVAIARALINDPPLLLADEPTGNLDPDTSLGIVQLLNHIHQQGTTILVATHDSHIVDQMQKRVIAFAQGKLVRDDAQGAYRQEETPVEQGHAIIEEIEEAASCP